MGARFEKLLTAETDISQFNEIESICRDFADYFREHGYSSSNEVFLEPHAYEIREIIKNPSIRAMHIMEG